MAEKTTVAGARAAVGYPVPVPSTAAASRANLTGVWVAPDSGRQAALVFDNGKVRILMSPASYQRALRYFRAFVAEKDLNRVTAALGQVSGRPALVVEPKHQRLQPFEPRDRQFLAGWRAYQHL
jgi:hypothetical protein